MDSGKYIAIGAVTACHGIKGELKVKVLTDFPERFEVGKSLLFGKKDVSDIRECKIEAVRFQGDNLVLKLEGVSDRNAAELFKGCLFYTDAPFSLPEGSFYIYELEGLTVEDLDGNTLGVLEEVLTSSGNDIYVVRGNDREYLIPALRLFVKKIDIAAGIMCVDLEKLSF